MKSTVKVMVTGGGAYMYNELLAEELGVEVVREEEMESLILGLGFVARIPEEVFWFSEELVWKVSHPDVTEPGDNNGLAGGAGGEGKKGDVEHEGQEGERIGRAVGDGMRSNGSSPTRQTVFEDPSAQLSRPTPDQDAPTSTSATDSTESPHTSESPSIPSQKSPSISPPQSQTAESISKSKSKPSFKLPQTDLERPSPTPPQYSVTFATPSSDPLEEPEPNFPCLVVNIGSGVSIVRVDEDGGFERVSGTSLGGGTLWGLLSLLTDARSFDGELCCTFSGGEQEVRSS